MWFIFLPFEQHFFPKLFKFQGVIVVVLFPFFLSSRSSFIFVQSLPWLLNRQEDFQTKVWLMLVLMRLRGWLARVNDGYLHWFFFLIFSKFNHTPQTVWDLIVSDWNAKKQRENYFALNNFEEHHLQCRSPCLTPIALRTSSCSTRPRHGWPGISFLPLIYTLHLTYIWM